MQAGTRSSSALPSPYLGSSVLAKTGRFLPKRKVANEKEETRPSILTLFQQAPQKKVTEEPKWLPRPRMHRRQLSQVLHRATSGCPASGASEPGTNLFLWRKLFLKQKCQLAGVGRACWVYFRYSRRRSPDQRASTREMVFQKQVTLIPQGGKKKELQTQVTYFHCCHKDLYLNEQKARSRGYGCRSTFADIQLVKEGARKRRGSWRRAARDWRRPAARRACDLCRRTVGKRDHLNPQPR